MIRRAPKLLARALASTGLFSPVAAQAPERPGRWDPDWQPPRTAWSHPDLQGNWGNVTLTPFERPRGAAPLYTWAQVDSIEGREVARVERGFQASDPNRARLQPSGSVGGYNRREPARTASLVRARPARGVAYWTDGEHERIFHNVSDARLVA